MPVLAHNGTPFTDRANLTDVNSDRDCVVVINQQSNSNPIQVRALLLDDSISLGGLVEHSIAHRAMAAAGQFVHDNIMGVFRTLADSGKTAKHRFMTRLKWEQTGPFAFELHLLFLASSAGHSSQNTVISPISRLYDAVFPTTYTPMVAGMFTGLGSDGFFEAPLGYSSGEDTTGMFTVNIGTWFRMPNALLTGPFTPTFQTVCGPEGQPLYAVASVTFAYFETPTAPMVKSFFLPPRVEGPHT